jgi:hypothetical protein
MRAFIRLVEDEFAHSSGFSGMNTLFHLLAALMNSRIHRGDRLEPTENPPARDETNAERRPGQNAYARAERQDQARRKGRSQNEGAQTWRKNPRRTRARGQKRQPAQTKRRPARTKRQPAQSEGPRTRQAAPRKAKAPACMRCGGLAWSISADSSIAPTSWSAGAISVPLLCPSYQRPERPGKSG